MPRRTKEQIETENKKKKQKILKKVQLPLKKQLKVKKINLKKQ